MLETRSKAILSFAVATSAVFGMLLGSLVTEGFAQTAAPTAHKGLKVETLGVIEEESLKSQVGLEGHIMLLRAITIEPGGHIAKHSHQSVPGLVKVISGEWVEGTASGERTYSAETNEGIIEDSDTVNWFFNRGDEPATAIVCDIKPKS
jgi:quercetin dioxygenase-like cupin family protein